MKKAKRTLTVTLLIALLVLGYTAFYYYNVFARTAAVATLSKLEDHHATFEFQDGSQRIVAVPTIVLPLLEKDQEYFVSIYRNNLRGSFLKSIEASE